MSELLEHKIFPHCLFLAQKRLMCQLIPPYSYHTFSYIFASIYITYYFLVPYIIRFEEFFVYKKKEDKLFSQALYVLLYYLLEVNSFK